MHVPPRRFALRRRPHHQPLVRCSLPGEVRAAAVGGAPARVAGTVSRLHNRPVRLRVSPRLRRARRSRLSTRRSICMALSGAALFHSFCQVNRCHDANRLALALFPAAFSRQPCRGRAAQHRAHLCRRRGIRRHRMLRRHEGPDAAYRPPGRRRTALYRRPFSLGHLHPFALRAADRPVRLAQAGHRHPAGQCPADHRAAPVI